MKKIPNPGSDEAIKKGCTCAVLDNRHGLGAFDGKDGVFWITEGCPLHNKEDGADALLELLKQEGFKVSKGQIADPIGSTYVRNGWMVFIEDEEKKDALHNSG